MYSYIQQVKQTTWFYEFKLPDGTFTESYLPPMARAVHHTREQALSEYLASAAMPFSDALDVSCHEGYFSFVARRHIAKVTGIDKNESSITKAQLMANVLSQQDVVFKHSTLEAWPAKQPADLVLCFGLLYHTENPIEVIRKLAAITKRTLCIETQVLPFNLTGAIEDGSYQWQRELHGIFGLCKDYAHSSEGGLTDLALVPSKEGLTFLLEQFEFSKIHFYQPKPADYEQFTRGQRVILFAEKA